MLNTIKFTALTLGLTVTGFALACSIDGKSGFLPENDFYISANQKGLNGGLNEAQFNSSIDRVVEIYEPVISNLGATLKIEKNWDDGTVNAYASQAGKIWTVAMFGGLARYQSITEDGMSLVVCHELGHHIGGAPKKGQAGGWWGGAGGGLVRWASNEGQADYFGTLKCLRKVFLNDNNSAIVKTLNAPKSLVDACKKQNKRNQSEADVCVRMGMAGKSVADLFSGLGRLPESKFESPDTNVVSRTDDNHPKAQCRLDTYFQGALCEISMNEDVSQTDEVKGTCHASLGHKTGLRPLCWFKPSVQ